MSDLRKISSNCNMDTTSMTAIAEEEMIEDDMNLSYAIPSGPVTNTRAQNNAVGLSPMSEIALRVSDHLVLNRSTVTTPVTAKARSRFNGECLKLLK